MSYNEFLLRNLCNNSKKAKFLIRQTSLQEHCKRILEILKKNPKSQIFLTKVNKRDAYNYYDIIKNPMDLGTVSRKISIYKDLDGFKDDLDLIWSNCLIYNTAEYYVDCALSMRLEADSLLLNFNKVTPQIPESYIIDGIPSDNLKPELKKCIAKFLLQTGFRNCSKNCLDILTDVMEYNIIKAIKDSNAPNKGETNK